MLEQLQLGQAIQGLISLFTLQNFALMLIGITIGFVFGILPGVSGFTAITLLLPLIYGMDPTSALILLLACHSIAVTGGSITAVLLGIPGDSPNAATIIDGFPMTQQGKGGQALGAALMSSLLGGVFGAVVLALTIPLLLPMALAFKSPELFLLIILGILCIVVLSRGSLLKGLISGVLGLVLSFIGYQGRTAMLRFTFDWFYLYDGIKLVPLSLGLFAMPVIIDLAARGATIAKTGEGCLIKGAQVMEGVKDVFRHFWLFLRSSAIGTWMGILPGVGGTVAAFVAYGQARETSKNRDKFGHGAIEGVIAPEAANNAKEGGALLPTLVLGLPGSGAMAILLGAFILVGLQPGPLFLVQHMDIGWALIWTLVLANVLAGVGGLFLAGKLAKVAFLPGYILVPFLLILVLFGAFSIDKMFMDIIMVLIFGALGYGMEAFGYNRPALLLGFILGPLAEKYFFISLSAHGPLFFLNSPISIALLILIVLVLSSDYLRALFKKIRGKA